MRRRVVGMVIAAIAGGWLLSLAACNTVEGAGKDIEKLGENMSDAAREERDD